MDDKTCAMTKGNVTLPHYFTTSRFTVCVYVRVRVRVIFCACSLVFNFGGGDGGVDNKWSK